MICQMRLQSPLVKIFPDEAPQLPDYDRFTALPGETVSLQMAYCADNLFRSCASVHVDSMLNEYIRLRTVELVPCGYPCHRDTDGHYLRTSPGLFPDYLKELRQNNMVFLVAGQWRSIWIDIELPEDIGHGSYDIKLSLTSGNDELLCSGTVCLQVTGRALPEQTLIHTEWFHSDCLADYYQTPVLSERWWGIVENFIQAAGKRGINMILTPTFTPPLDTAVGGERTTVQLVDVVLQDGRYSFGFDNLERWIRICRRHGIKYIELAHLFTQWGAKASPKVTATVNGQYTQLLGWDTPADSEKNRTFLAGYLPALLKKLDDLGVRENTYFHISDEPEEQHFDSYRIAKEMVAPYLKDCKIIDALSSIAFYKHGTVERPVPATNHIEAFLESGIPNLWTYYCTGQYLDVSNRFFAMPSSRNRIIGVQMYKFNIKGFLHWGYNFYNSMHSTEKINPFENSDALNAFPGGDPFLVYPHPDGTVGESIRMMVLHHALQDMRAMQLLESLAGRERVLELIDAELETPVTFSSYPTEDRYILSLREIINREIEKYS